MLFTPAHLSKALSYYDYRVHIEAQLTKLGADAAYKLKDYAISNLKRVKYLEENIRLNPELAAAIDQLDKKLTLVILTEGWCGDACQNLVVFELMEKYSHGKIDLKLLLRDENLEVMDQYLTNGGRSIPKIISLERDSMKELFVWGPRPQRAQELMETLKERDASMEEKINHIFEWYQKDDTASTQLELKDILLGL